MFSAISDFFLRRRARRELAKRDREDLLADIDRDLAERESKVVEIKQTTASFGGSGIHALEELYQEIRQLRRYRRIVEKIAGT
jgi:hypothetical protein